MPILANILLAFPGALGYGANATGGRGGNIIHVTTLNDSGPGSLREAVSQSHRIVIFDVGGYINLQSALLVKSNITLLGQTAPGQGIGIMGREVSFNKANNVIVHYLRFRQGMLDPDKKKSGINLLEAHDLIFNHVSIEFAQYDNIDAVGATNITVQNSIIGAPTGQQFGAHTEGIGSYLTFYGNLFIDSHNRNVLAKANTQFINNVLYDCEASYTAGNSSTVFQHDVINNYFLAGPKTGKGHSFYQVNKQKIFLSGNLADDNKDGTLNGTPLESAHGSVAETAPQLPGTTTIPALPALDAYNNVLAHVGASLHRDDVDTYLIKELLTLGKDGHMWESQSATGLPNNGYGTLTGGPTPNFPANPAALNPKTGYTTIEEYAFTLTPTPPTTATAPEK